MKALIAYYSWSENTRKIAQQIKSTTGADLFEIAPAAPYPADYKACVDQAKAEIAAGARPAYAPFAGDPGAYDVIFVGSPNWWSTIAPPVASFLAKGGFAGKKIAPFVSHGGGGLARCAADMAALCPQATLLEAYTAQSGSSTPAQVAAWLERIGIN